MKALDSQRDYFEYLVVIANNLGFVLSKFGLNSEALEQLRNSVGYLVSFITKDRVIHELNHKKTVNGEIVSKARRMVQRILLVRLYLRQTYFLNLIKSNAEALDSARQAHQEASLVCLDTIQLGLMVSHKMEVFRRGQLDVRWNKNREEDTLRQRDASSFQLGLRTLRKLTRNSDEVNKQFGQVDKGLELNKADQPIFNEKQRQVVEHLQRILPIAYELKKFVESQGGQWQNHRKIKRIEVLQAAVKDMPLRKLNMTYLYANMLEEHYLFRQTVPDIIRLGMLELRDMDFEVDIDSALYQLSSQSLVEKVSWLVIATYCMAIEKSFVESNFATSQEHVRGSPLHQKLGTSSKPPDLRVPDS